MHSTIIEEHFVAISLTTPDKTVEKLLDVKEKIFDYNQENLSELEKYSIWKKEHASFVSKIEELNTKLYEAKNKKIDLWNFGEFKPSSILVWPFRFLGALSLTILLLPIKLFKNPQKDVDIEKSIVVSREKFDEEHQNYYEFIETVHKKEMEFVKVIKNELSLALRKSVKLIDFRGNEYDYESSIDSIDKAIDVIDNQLIPFYKVTEDVLYKHVHDVMTQDTIKGYIIDYITSSNLDIILKYNYEIDEIRDRINNKCTNQELDINQRNWKTTIDLINVKLKTNAEI